MCKQLGGSAAGGGPVPQRGFLQRRDIWALAGLCKLAHSIAYRVGAVDMFHNIFLLECCGDVVQEGS